MLNKWMNKLLGLSRTTRSIPLGTDDDRNKKIKKRQRDLGAQLFSYYFHVRSQVSMWLRTTLSYQDSEANPSD